MGHKKGTYAAKHASFLPSASELSGAFVEENADLWEILRRNADFEDNFLALPYARQIAMIDLFKEIMHNRVKISPSKLHKILLDQTYDNLERICWLSSSSYDEGNPYYPIEDDEKKLVRMECYGTIDMRREHELSQCYKFFRKEVNCGKFRLKDYDLAKSPMWRVFNQFESFREMAPTVRRHLYKQGINPDALKVMTVNDFCDVIHKIYAKTPETFKAQFLPIGYKKRFVINFMRSCGQDLAQHLLERGIDKRKVHALCYRMAKYGVCDIETLIIPETHFTPRVLKDLANTPYFDESFKEGDRIPEELIERMFRDDKEHLLTARDENGYPLDKDDLPHFEVHHKNAVKFSNDGDYLAKANYPGNLMLVEHEIHRAFFHGFDDIADAAHNNAETYAQINIMASDMCMINGFDPEKDMIFYDLENNPSMRKRIREDKKCVVNFYEMQSERLNNIPEIAEKYGIGYSKSDLNTERKNLMKMLKIAINIPAKDVHIFAEWMTPNATSDKIEAKKAKVSRRVKRMMAAKNKSAKGKER